MTAWHAYPFRILLVVGLLFSGSLAADGMEKPQMEVWKSPNCGCCGDWVDHMRANGYQVTVHDLNDVSPIKRKLGITPELASCHTATINGYVIEGHVPATDVDRLLKQNPDIRGLTVPGMPAGKNVPGMEVNDENARFSVLQLDKQGQVDVWNSYE